MRKLNTLPTAARESTNLPPSPSLARRDLISLHDLTSPEFDYLLTLAQSVKANPCRYKNAEAGCTLAIVLEKSSLRTRVATELAYKQLGGRVLLLGAEEVGLGKREAAKDVARSLSAWVDVILARVVLHQTVIELAEYSAVPVINGLSDFEHPCQALSDYFTLSECKGRVAGLTLAFVGDGNHIAHSLIYGAARLGTHMRIATPGGFEPERSVLAEAKREGGDVTLTPDPAEAVKGADVVYTDAWTRVGPEQEVNTRRKVFYSYQVNSQLMAAAGPQALFMHCQPARRGEEVTDEVMDSSRSLVALQAENLLHMQKAIFLALLN